MKALELHSYEGWRTGLRLVEKPVPRPGANQVLIRMAAAPVNPADFAYMKGQYGVRKPLPTVPGLEGSGLVVAAGGGLAARFLARRRVACVAPDQGDGTWAEYMVTSPRRCMPLRRGVSLEQGATALVNPLSAWAMLDLAKRGGHRAVAQTASAGALGRMLLRLCRRCGLTMVNIVRRPEQVALLRSMGADHVLSIHQPDFDDQLRDLCRQQRVTLALDGVAGEMTGRLLRALPRRAKVMVYGSLSNELCQVNPAQLIFRQQRVGGFWLTAWRPRWGIVGLLSAGWQVQKLLGVELHTEIQARLPLAAAHEGLEMYVSDMTRGKVLFTPGGSSLG